MDTSSLFWSSEDLVQRYTLTHNFDPLNAIRKERENWFARDCWKEVCDLFRQLQRFAPAAQEFSAAGSAVTISGEIENDVRVICSDLIERLHPWRKGPFELFGRKVDAEWRSDKKWSRIRESLGDLHEKRILDVGCGNGYYMFRAAQSAPRLVYGIDPSAAFKFQFELFQAFAQRPELQLDLLGVEHLEFFEKTFDVVLCMGIVYHHRGPLEILRRLKSTLRMGGRCLVESQSIPGDGSYALFPEDRYAKARNVFFVPTAECLMNWMRRAGFKDVELVAHSAIEFDEQRRTADMRFESLQDFLDPGDVSKTVEGYPAPWRTAVIGTRVN